MKEFEKQNKLVHYTIRNPTPTRVHDELLTELIRRGAGRNVTARTWDKTVLDCSARIRQISKKEAQRACRIRQRTQAQARKHQLTINKLFQTIEEELRLAQTIQLGLRLDRTFDSLRWQFKRFSNWEKDQTISILKLINGQAFRNWDTLANQFASEWRPILCQSHRTVPSTAMRQALHDFVTMPTERMPTQNDNE